MGAAHSALHAIRALLRSTAAGAGASGLGLEDPAGLTHKSTVEAAIAELFGLRFNKTLAPPATFGWAPPILPKSTPHGWRGNVGVRSLMPALGAVPYYVDVQHGHDSATGKALVITAITAANPPVVTYTGDDPTNGHQVYINDVVGMTEVNGLWFTVANVNAGANTFELSGIVGAGYTAYDSGGVAFNPLKGLDAAIAKADGTVIYVAPGTYRRDDDWGSASPATANASLVVLPWEIRSGPVISSCEWAHDATSWENDETYENTWKGTRSAVAGVRDYRYKTEDGEHWPYELAQSNSDCNNRRGTWYTDGATVWVHPFHDGMPDELVKVFIQESGGFYASTKTIYVEGVEFHGGTSAFRPRDTSGGGASALYMKRCRFLYGSGPSNGNGVECEGVAVVVLEDCEAAFNRKDGFNYHVNNGVVPKVIEINCRGHHNGWDREGINNGSSMHDAGTILRIGGEYAYNEGPNVPDVGASKSWNVGVYAHDSRRYTTGITKADFYNSGGDMWLFDCTADGSEHAVVATSGGTTRRDRFIGNGAATESGGTLSAYEQL